jgi:deoxyribodipyrimidine photo-lyase
MPEGSMKINVFWFRRDLRLHDNTALDKALSAGLPVLPVFIFDTAITDDLSRDDPRLNFIYDTLSSLNKELLLSGGSILVMKGNPLAILEKLASEYMIENVFINKDYEPYAIDRDEKAKTLLASHGIALRPFSDQVIFGEDEVVKDDGKPYSVFTPYKNRWLRRFQEITLAPAQVPSGVKANYFSTGKTFPEKEQIGIHQSQIGVRDFDLSVIPDYDKFRDLPAEDRTSFLSPHLRFGTVSIREIVSRAFRENMVFLNELIWREFFMQILFHYPGVVTGNFKPAFDHIPWRNNPAEFERWCNGETGYPIVDAGMRQLNSTGFMHNRVRMITAGFLCKHLLIDWRWGEAYFAGKLLDYELSSNNGNWQWAAGTGCDAAPWFRIFNPATQQKKFDAKGIYVRKWVPEYGLPGYPAPMVDHDTARRRAIETYGNAMKR